jgi:hypothetical protein
MIPSPKDFTSKNSLLILLPKIIAFIQSLGILTAGELPYVGSYEWSLSVTIDLLKFS